MTKEWKRGVNVTVSPEAHKKMVKETIEVEPRLTLRQHVNLLNGLPKEL